MAEAHEWPLAVIVEQLVRIDLAGAADGRLGTQHAILDVDADVERPPAISTEKPRWWSVSAAGAEVGVLERGVEGVDGIDRVLLGRAMQLIRWYRHGATMARVDRVSRFGPGVAPSRSGRKPAFLLA